MTYHTTVADLESKIERLNVLTSDDYRLYSANGGVSLYTYRGCNVFLCGQVPKRELAYRIDAFIEGIYRARERS